MATRDSNVTMFDLLFLPTVLFLTFSVVNLNAYDKSGTVFRWMEVDFIASMLFRLLITVEISLASGIRLVSFGEHVHHRARIVALRALYMILYPFLWAWNTIGFVWWFTSSEKDWLPGNGLKCCYFIFLIICFYELFCFGCSCVEKHVAAQRQHLHRSGHSHLKK